MADTRSTVQDYYGNISGYGQLPPPQSTAISGNISSLPGISNIASGINAINLGYQAGAIPQYNTLTGNVSDQAAALLDPNNAQANYDVSMHGAENAIGRGIAGSGAAAESTGRLRQADIERRAMLGNQLLSSQVSRLPKPFDPASQLLTPSQLSSENASLLGHLISRGQPDFNKTGGISYPSMRGGPSGAAEPFQWSPSPGDAGMVGAYGTPSLSTLSPAPRLAPSPGYTEPGAYLNPGGYGSQQLPSNFYDLTAPQQQDVWSGMQKASYMDPTQWGGADNPLAPSFNSPQEAPPALGSNYFSDWDLANPVSADYGWLD
jgi:hypothetical protein